MTSFSSFTARDGSLLHVRPFVSADRSFVLSLAPRLLIGVASWRDTEKMFATIQNWLTGGMERHGTETMVFIVEDEQGERLGFASVSHHRHYSGDGQAYIGELAVSEEAEGHGAGQALISACEQWAREQGYPYLALATGAANRRARGFYTHLGFLEEDVTLVKRLEVPFSRESV